MMLNKDYPIDTIGLSNVSLIACIISKNLSKLAKDLYW